MDDHRKPPETAPEYPPETTGTRWLPIAEVEGLFGKKERNARYWLERHAIPWQGERPKLFSERAIVTVLENLGQSHRKPPEHPPEHPPEYPPEASGNAPPRPPETAGMSRDPIEAAYRVLPEELERAIARTGERYVSDIQTVFDRVAALYEQRLAEKDAAITTVREEKDALIAELRRRAEAAETDLSLRKDNPVATLQQGLAEPVPAHVPEQTPAPRSWWRRIFGGD